MDWQKELEARLADDPRLERKKSRVVMGLGFFFKGKEVAHFTEAASVNIRLSPAAIFALGALAADDCVKAVSKEGILVRLESSEDVDFAQKILARVFQEKAGERRPAGKNTRAGGWSSKGKATKSLEDAAALKALKEFKSESED